MVLHSQKHEDDITDDKLEEIKKDIITLNIHKRTISKDLPYEKIQVLIVGN